MPCDMLGNTATLGDGTDSGKTRVVVGYRENPAVFAQPTVFVDDALCYVKHTDVGHHTCLLAVDIYPLVFIEVGADIIFRQIAQIGKRQASEGAKQVEVTIQLLLGIFQFSVHQ